TPRWHDWPMKASAPERGSSTPTLSLFDCARTIARNDSAAVPSTADAAASRLKSRLVTRDMVSTSRHGQGCDAADFPPATGATFECGPAAPSRSASGYHAAPAWSLRIRFRIFPVGLLGSSATMSTRAGTL